MQSPQASIILKAAQVLPHWQPEDHHTRQGLTVYCVQPHLSSPSFLLLRQLPLLSTSENPLPSPMLSANVTAYGSCWTPEFWQPLLTHISWYMLCSSLFHGLWSCHIHSIQAPPPWNIQLVLGASNFELVDLRFHPDSSWIKTSAMRYWVHY